MALRAGLEGAEGGPMSLFDTFAGPTPTEVEIECYTSAYRVSGTMATRFSRVADIFNQVNSTHLVIQRATISEHAAPKSTLSAAQVLVAVDDILFGVSRGTEALSIPDMRISKRPIRALAAMPPFRITGAVYVTEGSRPTESLVNAADQFVAMTEVDVTCATFEGLDRHLAAVALQRRLAELLLVIDDERPEDLLARVLDEETAQSWATRSVPHEPPPPPPPPPTRTEIDELIGEIRTIVTSRAPALAERVDAIGTRNLHRSERDALRGVLLEELVELQEGGDETDADERRARITRLITIVDRA
jgi:hypothetical protein